MAHCQPVLQRKDMYSLIEEWNLIAHLRHEQIVSHRDLSFHFVTKPSIFSLAAGADFERVMDIGCGSGVLTSELSKVSKSVVGIDPSNECISLARGFCAKTNNIEFVLASIEELEKSERHSNFTLAIANMTFMDCPDLDSALKSASRLMKRNARLVATITHPCFWPRYWNYAGEQWFDYVQEIQIEAPFRISMESSNLVTTHIHRPLEVYVRSLSEAGFRLKQMTEPMPSLEIQELYPRRWRFPRFLGISCTKM